MYKRIHKQKHIRLFKILDKIFRKVLQEFVEETLQALKRWTEMIIVSSIYFFSART